MQLTDLVKPIEEMTDEELAERLRTISHNRNTVRPAAATRAKKAAKKGAQTRMNKVESLLGGMTDAEKAELLKQLGA